VLKSLGASEYFDAHRTFRVHLAYRVGRDFGCWQVWRWHVRDDTAWSRFPAAITFAVFEWLLAPQTTVTRRDCAACGGS